MTIDERFALITDAGSVLYPYKKLQRETGRYGFAATTPDAGRDRFGGGHYTEDLEEVIRGVLFEGWRVRVKTAPECHPKKEGSYGLWKRSIQRYWLAPELAHLANGAARPPESRLPAVSVETFDFGLLTEADYIRALEIIEPQMSASQRLMLTGHARASNETLTMAQIAKLAGYEKDDAANLQYGALAKHFLEVLGGTPQRYTMEVIAFAGPRSELGHFQWTLRPALRDALLHNGGLDDSIDDVAGGLQAEQELLAEDGSEALTATERRALVNARIGQGGYRKSLLLLWGGKCAVTGCSVERVLIASHAKPWKKSSNAERLDPYNGLLLSANLDRLFDAGLISYSDDGTQLISEEVAAGELEKLGIKPNARLRFVKDKHRPFLAEHRKAHRFSEPS